MKKKYFVPEVEVTRVAVERSFLSNDPNVSSAPDLVYDSEINPW